MDQPEEFKVILKLKEGKAGFRSCNPIRLTRVLKEELGEIINARILADGNLLVFCRSAAQVTKAVSMKAIGERRVEGFVPGIRK